MKKILIIILALFSLVLVGCDESFEPLDKIHDYTIIVNPNNDGTLNMKYHLEWEVLEEGDNGVDFITVGVANRFVENIQGLSDNIKKIGYSSENGSVIRIDFNKKYHKGDIFHVVFSIRQERIFTVKNNQIQYSFNPGWFEEIQVNKLTVLWDSKNVLQSNSTSFIKDYLVWEAFLDYGDTIEVNLVYDKDSFPNLDPKKDYSSQTINPLIVIVIVFGFISFIIVISIIASIKEDKYQRCRGFSGNVRHHHFYFGRHYGYRKSGSKIVPPNVQNKSSGVHGSSCACACACACAGGGRAGCSRKDFNNYLKVE